MQRMGQYMDPNLSNFDLSISQEPTASPYPLGCPTGFYQQGNVCIPIVGTYPGDDFNAPPAGLDFAKGVIEDVDLPGTTEAGKTFQIRTHFKNTGAYRARFGTKITIAQINITAKISDTGFVPKFARGIVYQNITMPANAPLAQDLAAQIELVRWDEVQNKYVTDDVGSVDIPSPGSAAPPANTNDCFTLGGIHFCQSTTTGPGCIEVNSKIYCPQTVGAECKMIGGQEFCKSTTWSAGCIVDNGVIYCPKTNASCKTINSIEYCKANQWSPGCIVHEGFVYCPKNPDCKLIGGVEFCKSTVYGTGCVVDAGVLWCPKTTQPPSSGTAVIITSPQTSIQDDTNFKVIGSGFKPNSPVKITFDVVWHCIDRDPGHSNFARAFYGYSSYYTAYTGSSNDCSWEGEHDVWTINTTSNSEGKFSVTTNTVNVPSGVSGLVNIKATDAISTATTSIMNY